MKHISAICYTNGEDVGTDKATPLIAAPALALDANVSLQTYSYFLAERYFCDAYTNLVAM